MSVKSISQVSQDAKAAKVSFTNIITAAKNASVSASKLLALVKSDTELSNDFLAYLNALNVVMTYEGKKVNNFAQVVEYWGTVEVGQFVAFLGKNLKDTRKIDGSSLLGAIKSVLIVRDLQLLVLTAKAEKLSEV
jgi:c-di-GMP-related signal transduction protein